MKRGSVYYYLVSALVAIAFSVVLLGTVADDTSQTVREVEVESDGSTTTTATNAAAFAAAGGGGPEQRRGLDGVISSSLFAELTQLSIDSTGENGDDSNGGGADGSSVFDEISFAVHRNGEPEPCGTVPSSLVEMTRAATVLLSDSSLEDIDEYYLESMLTNMFRAQFATAAAGAAEASCGSTDNVTAPTGLTGFCDMGPDRTVVQYDHEDLIHLPDGSLPCRFHTREGLRISSLQQLVSLAQQTKTDAMTEGGCGGSGGGGGDDDVICALHLYAVPAGRVFMFAPSHLGEVFHLSHVHETTGGGVSLQVLSLNPRVFEITNFFSKEESDDLIASALAEKSKTHGLHRSTTGTSGAAVFSKRTSENAWLTGSPTAMTVKERCFHMLGFDEYIEEHADGLQILRYNTTKAYTFHQDYLDDPTGKEDYDFDSAGRGGNRFATILMYMSNCQGGQTVFNKAWPVDVDEQDRVQLPEAIEQLRNTEQGNVLSRGSWEEEMAAICHSRLSIQPRTARAALFYSQHPNGVEDLMAKHGGCPVLNGTKWAANLWVWNAPRPEFRLAPMKKGEYRLNPGSTTERAAASQVSAVFTNSRTDEQFVAAKLYYNDDIFFGNLGYSDPPVFVNTFQGHEWNVKNAAGETLQSFVIGTESHQEFVV